MLVAGECSSEPASISKHIQFHIDAVTFLPAEYAPKARAYLRVIIADRKDRLKTRMRLPHTSWEESLAPVALKDASQITFQLRHRPAWWKSGAAKLAVTATYPLSELLQTQAGGGNIDLPLCAERTNSEPSVAVGTLTLSVRMLSSLEAAKLSLDSATHSVSEFNRRSKTLSSKNAARYKAGYEALKPICGILDIVGPLIAFSPEPICAAVVAVVRGAAKSIKEQIEQDADVLELMEKIAVIYESVATISPLHFKHTNKNKPILQTTLTELVTVLVDCTRFMGGFCKSTFLGRVARTPEKAKELKELQERLAKAQDNLSRGLLIETLISLQHNVDPVAELSDAETLKHLQPAPMYTAARDRRSCEGGEHTEPRAHITAWATSPGDKNILWLRGPAGCGKSSVANTLCQEFYAARQHGGRFFFSPTQRDSTLVIRTFAAQLSVDPRSAITPAIAAAMRRNPNVAQQALEVQFAQLLLAPLQVHPPAGPLLFVLDGPDWCGREQEEMIAHGEQRMMQKVLRLLVEGSAHFPANVRLLICSRESEHVREVLGGCERTTEYEMEEPQPKPPRSRWQY